MATGNNVQDNDFFRLLLALKNNIMRATNVAELAIVEKVSDKEIICSMLNDSNKKITCVKFKDLMIAKNDIVLVIFTNTDFRTNLKRVKNNQSAQTIEEKDLHSKSYGVIAGII